MSGPDLRLWALQHGPARRKRAAVAEACEGGGPERPAQRPRGAGPLDGDAEVELLCELWAIGSIPAHVLQQIGEAAVVSSPRPQMSALAALGSHGAYKGNITRDLRQLLHLGSNDMPEPYIIKVPMWDSTCNPPTVKERELPIVLPHEIAATLYAKYRADFDRWIGTRESIAEFWSQVHPDDPRRSHPVFGQELYSERAIPVRMHGDGVPP